MYADQISKKQLYYLIFFRGKNMQLFWGVFYHFVEDAVRVVNTGK